MLKKDEINSVIPAGLSRTVWIKEDIERLHGHIVYIWWMGADALYVGRSSVGVCRPLNRAHKQAREAQALADSVEFIHCSSIKETEALERKLIRHLVPKYNMAGFSNKRQSDWGAGRRKA